METYQERAERKATRRAEAAQILAAMTIMSGVRFGRVDKSPKNGRVGKANRRHARLANAKRLNAGGGCLIRGIENGIALRRWERLVSQHGRRQAFAQVAALRSNG